jgi:hypothetical protein
MPNEPRTDLVIRCQACRQDFTFAVRQQRFYADRRLPEPKRCPGCRAATRRRVLTETARSRRVD